MARANQARVGGWLPQDHTTVLSWVETLRARASFDPASYIAPIQDLQNLVATTPSLAGLTQAMFAEGYLYDDETPLGSPSVQSWPEFLGLLNAIMTTAPEFFIKGDGNTEAAGLIGFPINALLDWPMGTAAGYEVFSNALFNRQFKKILMTWGAFLTTEPSRYVLAYGDENADPPTIPWLSDSAKAQMIAVACQPASEAERPACLGKSFTDIFAVPDPNDPTYLGYRSWDAFFTREFHPELRPVGDAPVVSACESAPLQYQTGVKLLDRFWLKGQPYSLMNMLNFDPLAAEFEGATVYQAFLSALSYHRWNAPVDGVVKKAFVVNGTYYLENLTTGIVSGHPDSSGPNDSQPFITSVATRAVIFIEADDPAIGLMAFVAVGMAEVSSCQIQVSEGQHLSKGDPLGMFHFGGSTHCLLFRPDVTVTFLNSVTNTPNYDATNVAVKSNLASVG